MTWNTVVDWHKKLYYLMCSHRRICLFPEIGVPVGQGKKINGHSTVEGPWVFLNTCLAMGTSLIMEAASPARDS